MEELTKEVEKIKADIRRITISESPDPQTYKYLANIVNNLINTATALLPTSTYSTSAPSGAPVMGSVWYEDTGVLATRKIWVYSGSAWVQMK